jgi:hypothetical protein
MAQHLMMLEREFGSAMSDFKIKEYTFKLGRKAFLGNT